MKFFKSSEAYRFLNGLFCIYKPPKMNMQLVQELLKRYLLEDLNALEKRQIKTYAKPVNVQHPISGDMITIGHVNAVDYARHPLVLGPIYEAADIELVPVQEMDYYSCGLCVMAINDGCDEVEKIRKARHMSVYRITGRLGRATFDYSETGKIIEKTYFNHVTPEKINNTGRRMVTKYQKLSFEHAGVNIQTQKAFELASKGLIRPKEDSQMIVYHLKCVHFDRPYFTIELHTINESYDLLKCFINDLGLMLRTTACYTKLNKIRQGNFTLDHALLIKHWTLDNILNSIVQCDQLLRPEFLKVDQTVGKNSLRDDSRRKYFDVLVNDFEHDPEEFWELEEQNLERIQSEGIENRTRVKLRSSVPYSKEEKQKYLTPV